MKKIYIVAPDIHVKDAVGNFCFDLASLYNSAGHSAVLCAQNYTYEEMEVRHVDYMFENINDDDVLFICYSIEDRYLDRYLELKNHKICYFHGVTPPELLESFDPVVAQQCRNSYGQFPKLDTCKYIIASSQFTADFLSGFLNGRKIDVLPPVFKKRFEGKHPKEHKVQNEDTVKVLCVGRVAPNKNIEQVIEIFAGFSRMQKNSVLRIVGSNHNDNYNKVLYEIIDRMSISDKVIFTGMVKDDELFDEFQNADIFITASNHEGFCIPVLEAMFFGLLTVAKKGNAAAEVLGDSGYSFDANEAPEETAAAIYKYFSDKKTTDDLVSKGFKRADEYTSKNTADVWCRYLI
ncbi:MAG: glycosyltransferase [Deferribacterales bacterium]